MQVHRTAVLASAYNQTRVSRRATLASEHYCVLCRAALPEAPYLETPSPLSSARELDPDGHLWEWDYIFFFNKNDDDNLTPKLYAMRLFYDTHVHRLRPHLIERIEDNGLVDVLMLLDSSDPATLADWSIPRAAFCVHTCCWKAIRVCYSPGDSSDGRGSRGALLRHLYRMGQLIQPLFLRGLTTKRPELPTLLAALPSSPGQPLPVPQMPQQSASLTTWLLRAFFQTLSLGETPAATSTAPAAPAPPEATPQANTKTGLAGLLADVDRFLPAELQHEVLQYLDHSLAASLIRAIQTAQVYLEPLLASGKLNDHTTLVPLLQTPWTRRPPTGGPAAQPGSDSGTDTDSHASMDLVVWTSSIFGEIYIRRLALLPAGQQHETEAGKRGGDEILTMSVNPDSIYGIQTFMGLFGIGAVSLIYADGSSSPWLGASRVAGSGYYGIAQGALENLLVLQDNMKVIRIDYQVRPLRNFSFDISRVYWNVSALDMLNTSRALISVPCQPHQVLRYLDSSMSQFLPLRIGKGPKCRMATGLTVYVNDTTSIGGVFGMVSHFGKSESYQVGWRLGTPAYLHLYPNERIVTLYSGSIFRQNILCEGPSIAIVTSQGRTALFGFFPLGLTGYHHWSYLEPVRDCRLAGLMVTVSSAEKRILRQIGTVEERIDKGDTDGGAPVAVPRILTLPNVKMQRGFPGQYCVTSAAMAFPIAKVRARHTVDRDRACLGMCIFYTNGFVEALGRWTFAADGQTIFVDVYDGSRAGSKPLTQMTFCFRKMADDGNDVQPRDFVCSIEPGIGPHVFPIDHVWEQGQNLGWAFVLDMDYVSTLESVHIPVRG